jgi:hypothetical protein
MSDLEQKVLYYLTVILYPPVSKILLRPAIEAINRARLGKMNDLVPMPGKGCLSVKALINGLHLHGFVHPIETCGYVGPVHRRTQDPVARCCFLEKLRKTLSFLFIMVKSTLTRDKYQ